MSLSRNIRRGAQARKSSIAVATQAVAPTEGKRRKRLRALGIKLSATARAVIGCLIIAAGGKAETVLINAAGKVGK